MSSSEIGSTPNLNSQEGQDYSLRHLEAELARIDVSIRREVLRWQMAGQDFSDPYRGLYVSDEQASALLAHPMASNWGGTVVLGKEARKSLDASRARTQREVDRLVRAARARGQKLRLDHLTREFGLSQFELDAFLVCLAPVLDLRYERLYGYLQDDITQKRPSINLILDLLCKPGIEHLSMLCHFQRDAPLMRFCLLEQVGGSRKDGSGLLNQSLAPDRSIVAWLLGNYHPHPDLGPGAELKAVDESDVDQLLVRDVIPDNFRPTIRGSVITCWGPDLARQEAAARQLALRTGRRLLIVDLKPAEQGEISLLRTLRLQLRDARLLEAIAFVAGWDICLEKGAAPPPELAEELVAHPGIVITSGTQQWQPRGVDRTRHIIALEFPTPTYRQRLATWRRFLRDDGQADDLDVPAVAGQFVLTSGQTRDSVASARDQAAQRGGRLRREDLFAAARLHSNPNLTGLARKIDPRFGWEDIVLPQDRLTQLQEIISTVRNRSEVLEAWGVGRKLASSRGVTVLFSGEPGTGKTMAAEILAGELGLDLYKIDLSSVVSKYIGETEKNLERIFDEAESSNAILFFDEADALFGKRSEVKDAHDRYANIEISYLLQRMEAYDGVTILATNLRANLDEAFTRRLQFAVDFPFPDEEHRLRIWLALFPPGVPRDPGIDFRNLAQRFKLAGGNIRNIIVSAAYFAAADGRQVTMDHLLHGTRRELQKMGRLVDDADFGDSRSNMHMLESLES
jgi:hypothetical protein